MKEYLDLLSKRELKIVSGKRFSNLWLLISVLTAMLLAVAFSNGSLKYLSEKMNDPFTNWVDIANKERSEKFTLFTDVLKSEEIQSRYMFTDVHSDYYYSFTIYGANNSTHYLKCRFFEQLNTKLIKAILNPDNVVRDCAIPHDELVDNSFGFIITEDVAYKLGYSYENLPAYINYLTYSPGADTLGLFVINKEYSLAPLPILGVVKRLPGNMDMVASSFLHEQQFNSEKSPFNVCKTDYAMSLRYYVMGDVEEFERKVREIDTKKLISDFAVDSDEDLLQYRSWNKGTLVNIYPSVEDVEVYKEIDNIINESIRDIKIQRIFKYKTSPNTLSASEYISVYFHSLDSIRSFEQFAKDEYNVQIEMSQVNAKENFNDVSMLANILSWAMVIFSIICIVMFIVNMLQNYFQKVKKNLGTFKAFGISSMELIGVYVAILLGIILVSIVVSFCLVWIIELVLPILNVLKDDKYSYLMLWSTKTIWALIIIVIASIITAFAVMLSLLSKTPGDLIYDR